MSCLKHLKTIGTRSEIKSFLPQFSIRKMLKQSAKNGKIHYEFDLNGYQIESSFKEMEYYLRIVVIPIKAKFKF